MVSLRVPASAPVPVRPRAARAARDTWLLLAGDDHGFDLLAHAGSADVVVVADAGVFLRHLVDLRPRITLCAQPPADALVLAAVAAERRRRPEMLAVHLAPPHAVAERLAALDAGFDDALATTVPAMELAGRIAWLAARAPAAPAPLTRLPVTLDLVLDLDAHALWRDGQAVHLRPKEYALLALLASHPGRAFSREELLRRVWGPSHAADSRTVDVHVRWLRSKIEPDPGRAAYLVTVRGTGYRFDPPR